MRKHAWIVLVAVLGCFIAGCSSETNSDQKIQSESLDEGSKENAEPLEVSDKKLYVLQGENGAFELSEGGYVLEGPEMEYGEATCITADVKIEMNPKYDIQCITIKSIKDVQPMAVSEIAKTFEPANAQEGVGSNEHFLMYTNAGDTYYIARNWPFVDIMKENEPFLSYDYRNATTRDPLQSFWIILSIGYTCENGKVIPDFSENEILNMSDDELFFLGLLESEGGLASVWEYVAPSDAILEEGYQYIGLASEDPAEDEEEARKKAAEEWAKYSSDDYSEIYLLAETDEYWLFRRSLPPMPGEKMEYMVVYKKDYFETKDSWPVFELTEDFVRNYMAYTYSERIAEVYIGEYTICWIPTTT